MTTIIHKLERNPAGATDAQVEQLAQARYTAGIEVSRTDGIYLHVLVAACQAKLGPLRRGRAPAAAAQLSVVDAIHDRFYAAVLRGITTQDVMPEDGLEAKEQQRRTLERNRRSTFARTAKATLVAFARGGGDLRSLDATSVSKAQLRAAVAPPPTGDKTQQRIARGEGVLLRAIRRQARDAPDAARTTVERLMDEFQKVLDGLTDEQTADVGATTTLVARGAAKGHTRTHVGTPMLNRPAAAAP